MKRNKAFGKAFGKTGRRGRRPLRHSIGKRCAGVGLLDDPPGLYRTSLVKCHCEGAPRPWQSASPLPKIFSKYFRFPS